MKAFIYILYVIAADGSEVVHPTAYETKQLCQEWGSAIVEDFHLSGHRCRLIGLSSVSVSEAKAKAGWKPKKE